MTRTERAIQKLADDFCQMTKCSHLRETFVKSIRGVVDISNFDQVVRIELDLDAVSKVICGARQK